MTIQLPADLELLTKDKWFVCLNVCVRHVEMTYLYIKLSALENRTMMFRIYSTPDYCTDVANRQCMQSDYTLIYYRSTNTIIVGIDTVINKCIRINRSPNEQNGSAYS